MVVILGLRVVIILLVVILGFLFVIVSDCIKLWCMIVDGLLDVLIVVIVFNGNVFLDVLE